MKLYIEGSNPSPLTIGVDVAEMQISSVLMLDNYTETIAQIEHSIT